MAACERAGIWFRKRGETILNVWARKTRWPLHAEGPGEERDGQRGSLAGARTGRGREEEEEEDGKRQGAPNRSSVLLWTPPPVPTERLPETDLFGERKPQI